MTNTNNILKFKVVIPVHNGGEYIAETIESVLNQTYYMFDLIILENGSTDDTLTIVNSFRDSRIQVLIEQDLLPIEQNWARITSLEGQDEYLVILCADDLLYPTFLERIATAIRQNPDACLFHTQAHLINDKSKIIAKCTSVKQIESGDEFLDALHSNQEPVMGSGYVMKFSDFKSVGGYPDYPRLLLADVWTYFSLTRKSYKVNVPEYLTAWRIHNDSEGYNPKLIEFLEAVRRYQVDLENAYYFHGSTTRTQLLQYFTVRYIRRMARRVVIQNSPQKLSEFVSQTDFISNDLHYYKAYDWDLTLKRYLQIAFISNFYFRTMMYYFLIGIVSLRYLTYLLFRQLNSWSSV